jgi:UDP-N-acetylmuramyl pentapeptide phosphotransferase/UDP-N-acetylglucosamine-1-phosphate transferase
MDIFGPLGLLILCAAAAICAGLILLLRPQLQRYALARPNARSSHQHPTPQGGGIAVVATTLALALVLAPVFGGAASADLGPIIAATLLLAIVGAVDDIRTLEAAPRLILQFFAVGLVVITLPNELQLLPLLPVWLERGLLVLAGVWFVNLVNFMDGIDWMTVAEVVPVSAAIILIGILDGLPIYAIVIAIALCGAMLGFAPFNRPVAKLFLGDVGSLPIGLLLGWLLLLVAGHGHPAAALLLPLYYVGDATVTLGRRLLNGEKVWHAHRTHFYQRATAGGFTVSQVVGHVFAVNVILVVLALATVVFPTPYVIAAAIMLGGILVAWLLARFRKGRLGNKPVLSE